MTVRNNFAGAETPPLSLIAKEAKMDIYVIRKHDMVDTAFRLLAVRRDVPDWSERFHIYENHNFLIISSCELTQPDIDAVREERLCKTERYAGPCAGTSRVCASMKLDTLMAGPEPYRALAEWIFSLKYAFTQVKEYKDLYGELFLVLFDAVPFAAPNAF